jgi:F0F1-type ATP synthase epsilon subunit
MLEVTIISPQRVIFEDRAKSILLPGEQGVFELAPFHRNIISRLIRGAIVVDGENIFNIRRGVIKLEDNKTTIIVEEA